MRVERLAWHFVQHATPPPPTPNPFSAWDKNCEVVVKPHQVCQRCPGVRRRAAEKEEMGCTSAKQVSAVPNGEEAQNKSYSNGDLLSGQCTSILLTSLSSL